MTHSPSPWHGFKKKKYIETKESNIDVIIGMIASAFVTFKWKLVIFNNPKL